jgi:hypothetical protein
MSHKSQSERLLALLRSYGDFWCPLPEIMKLGIACHTKRVSELRDRGFDILCDTSWVEGVRHSRYKLVSEPGGAQ